MRTHLFVRVPALFFALFVLPRLASSQVIDWAAVHPYWTGPGSYWYLQAPTLTDHHSNVIGIYGGTNPLPIGDSTFQSGGPYLAALDTTKHLKWAYDASSYLRSSGTFRIIQSMCVDSNDHIYLLIAFADSIATFGDKVVRGKFRAMNQALLRLDGGEVAWAVAVPGKFLDWWYNSSTNNYSWWGANTALECSPSGELYLLNRSRDSIRIGSNLISAPHKDIMSLFHFGPNGSLAGYRRICTTDTSYYSYYGYWGNHILTAMHSNGCAVISYPTDSVAFDTSLDSGSITNSPVVLRYSSSNALLWSKTCDPTLVSSYGYARTITSDRFNNIIFYSGAFSSIPVRKSYDGFPLNGRLGAIVEKLDPQGVPKWIAVGPVMWAWDNGLYSNSSYGFRTDYAGNVYFEGIYDSVFAVQHHLPDSMWAWVRLSPNGEFDRILYEGFDVGWASLLPIDQHSCYLSGYVNRKVELANNTIDPGRYILHVRMLDFEARSVTADTACPGSDVVVHFTTSPQLYPNDTCVAEISDSAGDFSQARAIGSIAASRDTSILCHIPDEIAAGTYHVQVFSKHPWALTEAPGAQLVVRSRPPVRIVHPKGLAICQGDEAELAATAATHYLWSTGDTSRSVYVSDSGTYVLSGIDDNGCSNTDSVHVTVNPLPKVSVKVFGKLAFCEGDSVRLQASGAQSYLWSNLDTGRVVTIKEAGVYRAFGRDGNSCEGRSDSVIVTVYANPPKPTITREGDELVSSSDSNNQWYYKGLKIDAGKGKRFPLSAEGTYTVSVTNEHGCSTISDPFEYKKTSNVFPEFEGAWHAHIAQGVCSIVTDHSEPFEVEVVDILGRRIAMPFEGLIASEQNVELPAVPAGTYFVRIATVSRVVTLKYSN